MKMNLNYIQRRRVFKNSLVLATTLATSMALYANDSEVKIDSSGSAGQSQTEQQGSNPSLDAEARIDSRSNSSIESSGAPGQSQTDKHKSGKQHHGDKATMFIKEASMSNKLEIQAGQMAQQKSQNPEVKRLAETIVREHQQVRQRLQ